MHVLKVLKGLAVYADDQVDEALEQKPSPERAERLTAAILDEEAIKRVAFMVHQNADFPWDEFIEGLED